MTCLVQIMVPARNTCAANAKRVLATGGASSNAQILQIISDVFGLPVYTYASQSGAAVGAAYRAKHGASVVLQLCNDVIACRARARPDTGTHLRRQHGAYLVWLCGFDEMMR